MGGLDIMVLGGCIHIRSILRFLIVDPLIQGEKSHSLFGDSFILFKYMISRYLAQHILMTRLILQVKIIFLSFRYIYVIYLLT